MRLLKVTEEYRTGTEQEANEKGYMLGACGFTYKDKKSKGEIIDDGYLIKVVKKFSTFWE